MTLLAMMLDRRPEESFEKFWSVYPRKDKKIDAKKAWGELLPDDVTVQAILDALSWQRRQKAWRGDKCFIPLAGTYIRGEYWKNEAPPHIAQILAQKPPPRDDATRAHVWRVQQRIAEDRKLAAQDAADEYYRTHPLAQRPTP